MRTEHRHSPPMAGRAKITWGIFAVIAFFYLWTEHQAHLLGVMPYLLLLLCPLMHLFMHHGHGTHNDSPHEPEKEHSNER